MTTPDTLLKASVVQELEWAPDVNSTRIGVSVHGGAVTLSGQVESYPELALAEQSALRVPGVNAVAQHMTVEARWPVPSDLDLAKLAAGSLATAPGLDRDTVHVVVADQVVTLSGSVRTSSQRETADQAVRYLAGVAEVVNSIVIHAAVTSADISMAITSALLNSVRLDTEHITVSVDEGAVVLEGTVGSWSELREAGTAAWASPGVTSVANHLSVRP